MTLFEILNFNRELLERLAGTGYKPDDYKSVSYTHLDVYKRQIYPSSPTTTNFPSEYVTDFHLLVPVMKAVPQVVPFVDVEIYPSSPTTTNTPFPKANLKRITKKLYHICTRMETAQLFMFRFIAQR